MLRRLLGSILIVGFVLSLLVFWAGVPGRGERQIRYELTHQFAVDDPQFLRSMGQLLGPAILPGNRVTALQNGDQIFPSMLEAIRGARESITFETYIYWSGNIGQQFSDVLCERAQAGVKTRVLLDWLGSDKIDVRYLAAMKAAGVEVEQYHPLRWYNLSRLNNRTHRKLLVVDGRIGFTGGVGIADSWAGNGTAKDHWRDSQYKPKPGCFLAASIIPNCPGLAPRALRCSRVPPMKVAKASA
jgi:cardiolipin synthase